MTEKKFISLKRKMPLIFLVALFSGAALCLTLSLLTDLYVEKVYSGEKQSAARNEYYFNELDSYVEENSISHTELGQTVKQIDKNVFFYVYDTASDLSESSVELTTEPPIDKNDENTGDSESKTVYSLSSPNTDSDATYGKKAGEIDFADGTYLTFVVDYTDARIFSTGYIIAFTSGIAVTFLIYFCWTRKVTKKIISLSAQVEKAAQGDNESKIAVAGSDEISTLAKNTDDMRLMLNNMIEKEKSIRLANAELIAAMSHDLRTPLTALSGYLSLVGLENISGEKQKHYYSQAVEKAEQIKSISDRLFSYFSVYASEIPELELKDYDAYILFSQLLGEHSAYLASLGYNTEFSVATENKKIKTDTDSLKRIFDNIYNNIEKYAVKEEKTQAVCEIQNGKIIVTVTNKINKEAVKKAGTNIGHKSCRMLSKSINAEFETKPTGDIFEVKLVFEAEE